MSWGAVIGAGAALIGGKMSANSASKSLRAQEKQAKLLSDVGFTPWGTTGFGGAGVSFDNGQANFDLGSFQGLFDMFGQNSYNSMRQGRQFQDAANQGLGGILALSGQAGGLAQGAGARAEGLQQNGFQRGLQDLLFGGATQTAGRLNQGFDGIRDDTLSLLRQQAQPFEQRQFQGLQDTQFAQGIMGSTGGSLQTEAFARGLGQADISRQLAASGEARATQGSLQSLLGAQLGGGQALAGLENSLLNDAFNQFGSMSGLTADLNNTVFGRGQAMNQSGFQQLGGQGQLMQMLMGLGNFGGNMGAQSSNTRLQALTGGQAGMAQFGPSGNDMWAGFLGSLGTNIFGSDSTPFRGNQSSTPAGSTSTPNSLSGGGGYNPFAGMFPGMQ
jgi:hypothetical protein